MQIRSVIAWFSLLDSPSLCSELPPATRLGGGGDNPGVRFPAGTRDLSLLHSVQTDSGARPVTYQVDTEGSFHGGKAAGANHSPPSSTEVKYGGVYRHSPVHHHGVELN
jgi:hypothetical protein